MLQSRGGSINTNGTLSTVQMSPSGRDAESGVADSKHAFGIDKKQSDGVPGAFLSEKKKGALYSSLSMISCIDAAHGARDSHVDSAAVF